jgi:hypothetical protein
MARTTHPERHQGRRTLATAAAALTLALVGCSGQEDTSGLPPLASATTPTKPTSTGLVLTPEQQAVADAVTRFDTIVNAMSDGARLDIGKIATVAVDPALSKVGDNLFGLKALKNRTSGAPKILVQRVSIEGHGSILTRCVDYHDVIVVSMDPKPTTVGRGGDSSIEKISLVQVHGKWFIKGVGGGEEC